jgi:hypothetical protein
MLASDRLAPHFTAGELGAQYAPPEYWANLRAVAAWLEMARGILGVGVADPRLRVTSGWRSPEQNISVGGSPSSAHLVGLAADFEPLGQSLWSAWRKLDEARESGTLPQFDQIIFYPLTGHIHVGIDGRLRNEFRVRLYEGQGGTPLLTQPDTLPGAPPGSDIPSGRSRLTVLIVLAVVGAVAFALYKR